ncbi:hypothetical protein Gbem_4090 [Citrifermentans bemidjiense Bem]|uniref:Uncharacterized protein n=1 Tax=Citrifermentans bemidjiense (strain ATCC BAA-1014 / DSM 16622 / JCM 12645 / Bem) TaxID=404380 RepID=E1P696_CITBB|nr:hypothetical protein Gbem_4090 [Citrifermentans bemidjiense Bem]
MYLRHTLWEEIFSTKLSIVMSGEVFVIGQWTGVRSGNCSSPQMFTRGGIPD